VRVTPAPRSGSSQFYRLIVSSPSAAEWSSGLQLVD